jgi:nucleoside-diphosphate-sugar epimerase
VSTDRYLVTGASGFIGRHLVRHLAGRGDVMALVRPRQGLDALDSTQLSVRYSAIDVRDSHAVARSLEQFRPTVIFHLAAWGVAPGAHAPGDLMSVNIQGTYNILNAMLGTPSAERLVVAGSWFEYGPSIADGPPRFPRPSSEYGLSKLSATRLVQSFAQEAGVSALVLRPFQVYGPNEASHRLIPYVMDRARQQQPIELANPGALKDWVFVGDVVEAFDRAGSVHGKGEAIDIGTGVLTAVADVVRMVLDEVGSDELAVRSSGSQSPDRARSGAAETLQAEQLLGWKATTPVAAGIKTTVAERRQMQ